MDYLLNFYSEKPINTSGLFSGKKSAQGNLENTVSGILKQEDGNVKLRIFGRQSDSKESTGLENENGIIKDSRDGVIYGQLLTGEFIKINNFFAENVSTSSLTDQVETLFRANNIKISRSVNNLDESNPILSTIRISNLLYWAYDYSFFEQNSQTEAFREQIPSLGNFSIDSTEFKLTFGRNRREFHSKYETITSKQLYFEVHFLTKYSDKILIRISEDLTSLFSILMQQPTYVESILNSSDNELDTVRTIFKTDKKQQNYPEYNIAFEKLSYKHIKSYFPEILKKYFNKDFSLDNFVNSYLTSLKFGYTPDQSILMYCNAIETAFSDNEVENKQKKSATLLQKLTELISRFSPEIKEHFFPKEDDALFCQSIKDTRVFLVHGYRGKNSTILNGIEKIIASNKLEWIVLTTILIRLSIPENIILEFLKTKETNLTKGDFL